MKNQKNQQQKKKECLLSYEEILEYLRTDGDHKKAKILASKINKKIFKREVDDILYVKDEKKNYYKQIKDEKSINDEICFEITLLLEESKDYLDFEQRDDLKEMFKSKYKNLSKNATVKEMMLQIKKYIVIKEDSEFIKNLDNTVGEIHFYNGYIDIKTGEFKKRDINLKPVTFVINRNYKPSQPSQRKIIRKKVLKPIFPNKSDLDIMLLILGSTMTGKSHIDQSSLFWLGEGSNGKSLLMDLMKVAFGDYMFEFMDSTFESGNKDKNKILNSFLIYKYIRMAWINEFSSKPIDESTFKSFVDGVIKTTSLYKEGQNTIYHYAKVISTLNEIPKFINSTAMHRRIDAITGKSFFTDNEKEVNESKNIYLKDKNLKESIIQNGLLDSLVDIIVQYGGEWLNGKKIEPNKNENMVKSVEYIKDGNDKMKDFVDKYIITTANGNDRVNKLIMYELYKKHNPKSLITLVQLIDALKKSEAKIEYNKDLRNKDNTRGAFIGVKLRDPDDDEDPKELELSIEQQIESLENQKYGIEQQILKLKQQLRSPLQSDKTDCQPNNKKVEPKKEIEIKVEVRDGFDKYFEHPKEKIIQDVEVEDEKLVKIKKTKKEVDEVEEEGLIFNDLEDLNEFVKK